MTFLDCSVTGCMYNAENCCSKGEIQVEGNQAKRTEETCCSSFKERTGAGSNALKRISKETEVRCDACNCEFNDDHKCSAQHIGISGGNACECKETECASFCCRG